MTKANDYQVDGTHYQQEGTIQHWDYAASNNFDYFQGQITKYVTRWKKKNGLKDLEKARHFIEKYIEVEKVKYQIHEKVLKEPYHGIMKPREDPNTQYNLLYRARDLPPKIDRTGQDHPFGYDAGEEI